MKLLLGNRPLNALTAPIHEIEAATAVALRWSTQKNGTPNEELLHCRSGDRLACPVTAIIRMILYHRKQVDSAGRCKATPDTILATYYDKGGRSVPIRPKDVTEVLKLAARLNYHRTGIHADDITARSLRAGGAMALLCGRIDSNLIQMLGRWHSDAMMRYLHMQAQPIMRRFAATMFNGGNYNFLADETVPSLTNNE